MGRLRELVVLHGRVASAVDLLQQVVLLLAHDEVTIRSFFLSLLQLVFQRLCIDSDTTVADDLLSSV